MAESGEYEVRLEVFEGPLDLLLHLIRKNEMDIFDIPISIITDQYLAYLDMMKALNISVAGDFLVMAATLIHIKSRMLLPPAPGEEDEEDPRIEITRPLMEYLRLKEVAGELSERDILERDIFTRRIAPDDLAPYREEAPLPRANLFQLMDAFKQILERRSPEVELQFRTEEWSLKDKMTFIMERLRERSHAFSELFSDRFSVSELVATFLALLELVQTGLIRVRQPDPEEDIVLEAGFEDVEETARA
jgi:segregation and condensation protein A